MMRYRDIRQLQQILVMRRLIAYLLVLKYFQLVQNQRLIKVTDTHIGADTSVLGEYVYNANGQRVKKAANGLTTSFIYDQSGNLIEEADENGQINSDYIYLGSVPIARVDEWWEGMKLPDAPTGLNLVPGDTQLTVTWNANAEPVDGYKVYWGTESGKYTNSVDVGKVTNHTITGLTNGIQYYITVKAYADIKETYYYHTDHLGTPVMMTDSQGDKVWEGEFLPFGEPLSITGSLVNNRRFPGQYNDKETGLSQNGRRDYNPLSGIYWQRDPVGFRGGINLYSYGNNPVNLIDPLGLAKEGSGIWSGSGGSIGGMLFGGGVFTGIYKVTSWDTGKSCWIMTTCFGQGPGLGGSLSAESVWITEAYSPSDLAGKAGGTLAFGGAGIIGAGGSLSSGNCGGMIENPSSSSATTYGAGVGLGGGVFTGGCKTTILSCN